MIIIPDPGYLPTVAILDARTGHILFVPLFSGQGNYLVKEAFEEDWKGLKYTSRNIIFIAKAYGMFFVFFFLLSFLPEKTAVEILVITVHKNINKPSCMFDSSINLTYSLLKESEVNSRATSLVKSFWLSTISSLRIQDCSWII